MDPFKGAPQFSETPILTFGALVVWNARLWFPGCVLDFGVGGSLKEGRVKGLGFLGLGFRV